MMRIPTYLSPTSMGKYHNNPEDFYTTYLCETRTPRPPQKDYMSIGSGFDAYVKCEIFKDIFGPSAIKGSQFEFESLFEKQVESHNRDITKRIAGDVWQQYCESGAYQALITEVAKSPKEPRMEFRLEEMVKGIPLLGLPDLYYQTPGGVSVISDFKVNGSMSKTGASPFKHYQVAWDVRKSNTHGKPHKLYRPTLFKGTTIHEGYLEDTCDYWASQLATYAWLLGEDVGSEEFVIRMEQLCMRPVKSRDLPRGKFATHMCRVSSEYQNVVFHKYASTWEAIQSGHIFVDRTKEESDIKCESLDRAANNPHGLFPALDRLDDLSSPPRFFK